MHAHLDAQAKPPAAIKEVYKKFQKLDKDALDSHPDLIDLNASSISNDPRVRVLHVNEPPQDLRKISNDFVDPLESENGNCPSREPHKPILVETKSIPGLQIYPSLLPPSTQLSLLSTLLHRDLSNPAHNTNVHLHYHVPSPAAHAINHTSPASAEPERESYFSPSSSALAFLPKDPALHKPLTTSSFLRKKLRWMTLGGQYDWTSKSYPSPNHNHMSPPHPPFPPDVSDLIAHALPDLDMKPEAAIMNLYSPGDTLSLHRDVSEASDRPLLSLSLGCEGIFVVGLSPTSTYTRGDDNNNDDNDGDDDDGGATAVEVIRLRSGDALVMGGAARFAWHGVPRVLSGTCPARLSDWPAVDGDGHGEEGGRFEEWRGWMGGKRVNLNVRQMVD